MKTFLTLLAVVSFSIAAAQPTLTSANEAIPGISFSYQFADTAGIQPGPSGANQIWDFSNVVPSGVVSDQSWVDPSSTPYAVNYPGSDICQVVYAAGNPIYNYHTRSSTLTQLNGIAYSAGLGPNIMLYSDPENIRSYPATYNSTLSDTYAGTSTQVIGPLTTTTIRNGFYEYVVDGYGTLITPLGTFPNTLRMRLHQEFIDSTVYTGSPIPPVITQHFSTTWFWASTDAGDRLYQFYIGYDTLVTSAGTSYNKSVSYLGGTTGMQQQTGVTGLISAYPNPATGLMNIHMRQEYQGACLMELVDMAGRIVASEEKTLQPAQRTMQLDVSRVTPGLYLLKLTGPGNLRDELRVSVRH